MKCLKETWADMLHLFYPHVCLCCGTDLLSDKQLLCFLCKHALPYTGFAAFAHNPVEQLFWGRIPIAAAYSEFYFTKGSSVQTLIHQLKYKNNKAIGLQMGEWMGKSLAASDRFSTIDLLLPLPLFAKKEKLRGYNQAYILCQGISRITKLPVNADAAIRQRATETQTRKHRTERWLNVEDSFYIRDPRALKGKHLLLVDDVLTTGASLEALAHTLIHAAGATISIATLALASK